MKLRPHDFLVTAVVLLMTPLPVRADSKADAEALFEQGKTLGEKGQWNDACPKFEASLKAEAAIGTQYYLADCYERVDDSRPHGQTSRRRPRRRNRPVRPRRQRTATSAQTR